MSGGEGPGSLRFRVARHEPDGGAAHFDLWLERDGRLLSWRLAALPGPGAGERVAATRVFDHRLVYLEREGVLAEGRGRGRLTGVARGTYRLVGEVDGRLEVGLAGPEAGAFAGRFLLERLAGEPPDAQPWSLVRLAERPDTALA